MTGGDRSRTVGHRHVGSEQIPRPLRRGLRPPQMAIIETNELTKRYGSARGIEGVSMAVEPGRCSDSSGRTEPARRRRSARCSTSCTRRPAQRRSSGSTAGATALRSARGSAIQDGIDPLAFAGVTLAGIVLAAAGALLLERRDVLA
jgi:hypothetical protein